MNIVFFVSDLSYPPSEGLHEQTLLSIQSLARQGHTVRILGFRNRKHSFDKSAIERDLAPSQIDLLSTSTGWLLRALLPWRYRPQVQRVWQALRTDDVDAFHFEGIGSLPFFDYSPKFVRSRAVVNLIDPGSRRFFRAARSSASVASFARNALAGLGHAILESRLLRAAPVVNVVSTSDASYLKKKRGKAEVSEIPVMVPTSIFGSDTNHASGAARRVVSIVCDLRQPHMREAVSGLLKRTQGLPDGYSLEVLGRVADFDLEHSPGVEVRLVPWVESFHEYLTSCSLVVLPDAHGTGLKNRAVQALAAGVPVLATTVAMEGIRAVPGRDYILLESADDWVRVVSRALGNPNLLGSIARSGKSVSVKSYSPSRVTSEWVNLYHSLADSAKVKHGDEEVD